MRVVAGAMCALLIIPLVACSETSPTPSSVVIDSAGIRIVTSEPTAPMWELSPEPVLALGVMDGEGPEQFYQIRDVEILTGGRIAVADRGSEEIRVFEPSGEHVVSFGGPGRGPEEFVRLEMIEEARDSLFIYDNGNDRIQVRDLDGRYGRGFRLDWISGSLIPVHVAEDAHVLSITGRYMTELEGVGRVVDTALVSLYTPDGALVDSLTRLAHNERFVRQQGVYRTTVGSPFSTWASLIGTDRGFCYAHGEVTEVRCYDRTGRLESIARVTVDPRPVTSADVSRFWDLQLDDENPAREVMLRIRDDLLFPEFMPALSQLVVADSDRTWARRYLPETDPEPVEEWWVFDEVGLRAQLRSPLGFRVMDIEQGLVAGVFTDELGVEYVRVYGLATGAGNDSDRASR